ncbi:hypothetical protein VTK73DRAFT_6117 [Phialemonium thermophilum]|uniref:Ig-like domain-containing protein n=1 Tax=Phialemonium thermophilum TaxID=223376 RepID=A0ABR3V020_9PEZI
MNTKSQNVGAYPNKLRGVSRAWTSEVDRRGRRNGGGYGIAVLKPLNVRQHPSIFRIFGVRCLCTVGFRSPLPYDRHAWVAAASPWPKGYCDGLRLIRTGHTEGAEPGPPTTNNQGARRRSRRTESTAGPTNVTRASRRMQPTLPRSCETALPCPQDALVARRQSALARSDGKVQTVQWASGRRIDGWLFGACLGPMAWDLTHPRHPIELLATEKAVSEGDPLLLTCALSSHRLPVPSSAGRSQLK